MKNLILPIILIIILSTLLAIILIPWWMNRNTPQPAYQILSKEGAIEIRQYDSMLLATTQVSDHRSPAIRTGFKRLASYIFGHHQKQHAQDTIPMTAPVIQKKHQTMDSSPIAMTAPVMQVKNHASQPASDHWEVAFVMPKKYNPTTIPKPIDPTITLVSQHAEKYLTIRFSGLINSQKLQHKTMQLQRYANKNQIMITGEPILAFYDPPWIFPWLKRHEIWFLISKQSSLPSEFKD